MALLLNDIVNITYDITALGQRCQFGLNYRVTDNTVGGALVTELDIIADWFKLTVAGAAVANKLRAFLPTGATMVRVRVQKIHPTRSVFVAGTINQAGAGGAGPSTVNVCSTFALHTVNAGKNQIAKYHPGPMPNSSWADGLLTADGTGKLDQLADACTAVESAPNGVNSIILQPTIFHRSNFVVPRWNDVVGYRLNNTVRTERRRTIGIGI